MNAQERLKMAFTKGVSDWVADRWSGARDKIDDWRQPTDYSNTGMMAGGATGAGLGGMFGLQHARSLWGLAGGAPGDVFAQIAKTHGTPMTAYERLMAALLKSSGRGKLLAGGIGAGLGALGLGGLGHDVGKWMSPEKKWYQS